MDYIDYFSTEEDLSTSAQAAELSSLLRHGDLAAVKKFLDTPNALFVHTQMNETPLHLAVHFHRSDAVKLILNKAKEEHQLKNLLNLRNREGLTALMEAVQQKDVESTKILLAHKPQLNITGYDYHRNALHLAAQVNSPEIIDLLLDAGMDIETPAAGAFQMKSFRPIHFAAANFAPDAVKKLLERGADINARTATGATPLMVSIMYGCEGVTQDLLKYQPNLLANDLKNHDIMYYCEWFYVTDEDRATIQKMYDAQRKENPQYVPPAVVARGKQNYRHMNMRQQKVYH